MLTIGLGSRVFWLLLGLIPILVPEIVPNIRVFTMVFLIGISCCMSAVINVSWFPWFSEIVPLTIQSRFIALRDVILNGVNFVGGIVISLLLDYLPPETKYIIVFIIGGSAGILDMVSFGFCKEVYKSPPRKTRFSETLGSILKNKPFLRFMLYWTAYNFTSSFMTVYMNPYSINVMGLTFTEITVFGSIAGAVSAASVVAGTEVKIIAALSTAGSTRLSNPFLTISFSLSPLPWGEALWLPFAVTQIYCAVICLL